MKEVVINEHNHIYGVFTQDREFANYMIDKYVHEHNCEVCERIKTKNFSYAIMSDGTRYNWFKPDSNARGHICSMAIIDLGTCSLEFIEEWIPYLCRLNESKNRYILVDSTNSNKSYDLHTLIDRLKKIEMLYGNLKEIGFADLEYGWQRIDFLNVDGEAVMFNTAY